MSLVQPHRVRRLRWQVQAASMDDALKLRTLLHDGSSSIEAALDEVLGANDAPDAVRQIERVELDLRAPSLDALRVDLPQRVAAALAQSLQQHGDTGTQTTPQADARGQLVHYLCTGQLHWRLAGLAPDAALAPLREAAAEAWHDAVPLIDLDAPFEAQVAAFTRWLALLPPALQARRPTARSARAALVAACDAAIAAAPAHALDLRALRQVLATAGMPPAASLGRWFDERATAFDPGSLAALRRLTATLALDSIEEPARDATEAPRAGKAADAAWLVPLAGLVLLHPFLPRLLAGLKLHGEHDRGAITPAALPRAIALLHWLATGRDELHEFECPFVKLLLGQPSDTPLAVWPASPAEADRAEGSALLQAVIAHWKVLGHTSVEGLQASFLQRRGLLSRVADGWLLRLEARPFDLLLDRLPWSLSPIKLPWMDEPLQVVWR